LTVWVKSQYGEFDDFVATVQGVKVFECLERLAVYEDLTEKGLLYVKSDKSAKNY
jgi:hypothetical protein